MGRVITARDLELISRLFRRWGFVLVADIDDPGAFFIMTDESRLSSNADIAGFLIRILHGLGYDVEYFSRN
ncbi:hypothetical protein DRP04_11700 [Archaeoglobales archaeon]|nr:MAG: hypothetical protein DRP04_11700 [Archaeoglobales archaeon]